MNSRPYISIIIPIYNAEAFLHRVLDSIIDQSYKDYEVIMVDDGSTDDSEYICKEYIAKDERFKYLRQENSGPDIARKNGTRQSSGEYIIYIDADDYIVRNTLERLIETANETEADIVCSQIVRFDNKKEWSGSVYKDVLIIFDNKQDIMQAYFEDEVLIGTYYSKLIRRDLIADYDFVREGLIGEDITAALYMFGKAKKVAVIPDRLYFYYQNPTSISHAKYCQRHAVSLRNYIDIRDKMLSENLVSDKRICGYFAGFMMAVATAMSRSGKYIEDTGKILRNDLRGHWDSIKADEKTPLYMKACIRMYIMNPRFFLIAYRFVYLTTGR